MVSGLTPEKRMIQAGRKLRDALRVMRDLVRRERKADIYNRTFADLDAAVEEATDGLIEFSSIMEIVINRGITGTSGDVASLQALQESLSAMKAEREGLIGDLQIAQVQLQRFADDLQTLYKKEREKRAELAIAYERLKEADRLKSDFLSTITHELTTPLVPLDFSLQLIQKGQLDAEQQQTLEKMRQNLGQYKNQLDGLIKYARLVSESHVVTPKPFKVKDLLDDRLMPLQLLARGRNIELQEAAVDPELTLDGDADLIGSAMYQLVHNAIKFTKPGGHVQVEVIPEEAAMLFQITDDGEGIPEAVMQRFGQDFNQIVDAVKRGAEGLGLGLALTNYVASVHKGNLTAQSGKNGKGTTVQLRIPLKS